MPGVFCAGEAHVRHENQKQPRKKKRNHADERQLKGQPNATRTPATQHCNHINIPCVFIVCIFLFAELRFSPILCMSVRACVRVCACACLRLAFAHIMINIYCIHVAGCTRKHSHTRLHAGGDNEFNNNYVERVRAVAVAHRTGLVRSYSLVLCDCNLTSPEHGR